MPIPGDSFGFWFPLCIWGTTVLTSDFQGRNLDAIAFEVEEPHSQDPLIAASRISNWWFIPRDSMNGLLKAVAVVWSVFCLNRICESACPSFRDILPCYCTEVGTSGSMIICSGIDNSIQLQEATKGMKGLVFEKFVLVNSFHYQPTGDSNETNNPIPQQIERERLPFQWLSALRVKELEVHHTSLSSCFLCDQPLKGQNDFLVSIAARYSSLDGHLCNTCNSRTLSVSLKELSRIPRLKSLDLSWNHIEVIDGMAFPLGMTELRKVILANNKINKIHDNAFSTLYNLVELDLSNNELTAISRAIFRRNTPIQSLDLSWNSLQAVPDLMFSDLRALKELKLSYNLIEVLPADTWTRLPVNIEKLDFKGETVASVADCETWEYDSQKKQDMLLSEYINYWISLKNCQSKKPCLYLKDWHFYRLFPTYGAYITPEYFSSDWLNEFCCLEDDDYKFVYMGPKGTWTPFHADVFGSYSWSANVCGRKRWILFPPGTEKQVSKAVKKGSFEVDSASASLGIEVIQEPGEMIFVPSGWHHQVWNLDDVISINHNWFNGCNISYIWKCLTLAADKVTSELSDIKDADDWEEQCQCVLDLQGGIDNPIG